MKHKKYAYILDIVKAGMPVLLEGEAGTGKSTIAMQIAEDTGTTFYSISCTKQMSVNALLGFISINGVYIPTQFRYAFENGGIFLLDEIDAADPNVLLTLNTVENGFIAFPDGIVKKHNDFRLIATANPSNEHSVYTGRSKLDFSTLDRFFCITLERDSSLELALTSEDIVDNVNHIRGLFKKNGVTKIITMRDSLRLHKLSQLGVSECIYKDIIFNNYNEIYEEFYSYITQKEEAERYENMAQCTATTVEELWSVIVREGNTGYKAL